MSTNGCRLPKKRAKDGAGTNSFLGSDSDFLRAFWSSERDGALRPGRLGHPGSEAEVGCLGSIYPPEGQPQRAEP